MTTRKVIYLVDDMVTNHLIFKSHLKNTAYDVMAFKAPLDFLKQIRDLPRPDLLVFDIEMPEMNGLELATEIKKNSELQNVPIIFFTSLDDEEMMTKAYHSGAVEFISKSMKGTELRLRIENILNLEELKKKTIILNQELTQKLKINQILFRVLFHDLANLISIIDANTTLAQAVLENHPAMKRIEKTAKSVLNLKEILNSIRSLTDASPEIQTCSVKEAFQNIEFIFADRLNQKNLKFEYQCDEGINVGVPKSFLIHQILANFLTNAIKFSPENGFIKIWAEISEEKVHIFLQDSGTGMSDEIKDKILSEDQYFTTQGTQQEKGTGSGVKIAQFFIQKYQGELEIKSEQDKGTLISLSFQTAFL
jgi:two-component system sensor histidine kinase/response regulator